MLELVFVIVVAGILGVALFPRFERDNAGEAAFQIARHIRLAQHHALVENRFNEPTAANWQSTLWRISFTSGTVGECYSVWANRNAVGSNPAANELAVDPLTKKRLGGGTTCKALPTVNEDVLLWKSFGVSSLTMCGAPKHIAFDYLGRPGKISSGSFTPLANDCTITFNTENGHSGTIVIHRDTGFVEVTAIN